MIIERQKTKNYYDISYEVNYYNVRNSAWDFLIKNNVTSYPLDLHKILDNNHWQVKSFKTYMKKYNNTLNEVMNISPDGFTRIDDNNYVIYINENNNEQRNRFTICHEIGHIVLHKIFTDKKRLEKEANMFAARILMPMILIKELNIKTIEDLSKLCNVSLESAKFRLDRFDKIQGRDKFYTNPLEKKVFKQLKSFIKEKKSANI